MSKEVKIYIENINSYRNYPQGISLSEILMDINFDNKLFVLGTIVNNRLKEFDYIVNTPKHIEFIDINHVAGRRMYTRSISFVLYVALKEVFPKASLRIEHSISGGLYCRIPDKDFILTHEDVDKIKTKMDYLIHENIPFVRKEYETCEAISMFEKQGLQEKTSLLRTRGNLYTSVYKLDNYVDYFYGSLLSSTGMLNVFDLKKYANGMLLSLPMKGNANFVSPFVFQYKMQKMFNEYKRWGKILKISNIGDLNRFTESNEISEFIKISEALHEKKISQIADKIYKKRKNIRLILIAGPSSSGKTTFGKRLAIQMKAVGIQPVNLSLDNYFVNREDTPLDSDGEYDYESLKALDVNLFNKNLIDLFSGKEIELPKFSFETGKRYYDGEKMQLSTKQMLVVEGIHGLNPDLTSDILEKNKYKIYISALTSISIDGHNRIPSTDNRLIRRIVRDYRYRSYSAEETLSRWPSVRRGEAKNIFPFQEHADVMFNSALSYELGVLKPYADVILMQVRPNKKEYGEARRLLKFLSYFLPISDVEIPPTSLMREFLGGSTFRY